MSKRKTTEEFIEDSIKIHDKKYDYSLVEYISNGNKVKIICPTHGMFEIRPNDHLSKKVGCNKCNNASISKSNNVKKNIIERFNIIHNFKYDYSHSKYSHTDSKIKIICPIHGEFLQSPHHHLTGVGCQKCGNVYKPTTEEFIGQSIKVHGDNYNYSNVEYKNNTTKVSVVCKNHGIFEVTPNDHLNKKSGCPICKLSKGEILIKQFLDDNKIEYVREKTFNDCIYEKKMRFDFFIPKQNTCIEYDGEQHYKSLKCFGGDEFFKKTKKRDKIKNKYCIENNIELIRIPYFDYDNILKILNCLI